MTTPHDAVVLAGGAARRLGGADKPGVRVGGRPLLDRVLAACRGAERTVVVGAPRPTVRPVHWTREDPPGGGPLAALDAGVRAMGADTDGPATGAGTGTGTGTDDQGTNGAQAGGTPTGGALADGAGGRVLLVLSADLPFLDEDTVHRLLGALADHPEAEAALLTDAEERDQPLVAAYRTTPLRRELARIAEERGTLAGGPLRRLTGALRLVRVAAAPHASFDCDTWEDIATARARIREHGTVLDEWITAVKDELGIELDVDTGVLLDLARDAAHGVARPAAPLTTFLVGYAADGGGPEAVAEAARKAAALAQRWATEQDEAG
ncbi:NTP transferase domain-containing protein [Streptomyces sp. NPDC094447]|uniref:NTP transferase domain-containing protein n=1 Tax=Streptomyces sp. NPDC094447 TaxID=3366062 RepID=UPI003811A1E3